MKGICLAFLLDYFGHKCVCEFLSLSTSEQEEVVVVVVGGGGGCGLPLYPTCATSFVRYYRCRVSPSLCLCFFVCSLFFFLGGGGGGVGAGAGGVREDHLIFPEF